MRIINYVGRYAQIITALISSAIWGVSRISKGGGVTIWAPWSVNWLRARLSGCLKVRHSNTRERMEEWWHWYLIGSQRSTWESVRNFNYSLKKPSTKTPLCSSTNTSRKIPWTPIVKSVPLIWSNRSCIPCTLSQLVHSPIKQNATRQITPEKASKLKTWTKSVQPRSKKPSVSTRNVRLSALKWLADLSISSLHP